MRYKCNVPAVDRAYAFAKERILDGSFESGRLLTEGEVAGGAGMSRTPVREAFLRLESEGLLRLYPKRGALVVPVSITEVTSVLQTRLVVERWALEQVILRDIPLTEPAATVIATQERLAAAGDGPGFVEADREFHRLFVAAAGNPILLQLHDSLRDRQGRMGLAAISRDARRTAEIVDEHRELAAAVDARHPTRAMELIDRHLEGTLRLLLPGSIAGDTVTL
jgi:DNA-binding GntR family transcriptional regulator